MIPTLVLCVLLAVVAGIMLRSAIRAVLLIGLVLGIFFVSCYACDVSPSAVLSEGATNAHELYKKHRYVEFAWL